MHEQVPALTEPYAKRPIRFLEHWQLARWQLKVYSIAYQRELVRPELVHAAKALAQPHLDRAQNHYHTGFLGVHDGRGANFVFLDYWTNENELIHRVHASPKDRLRLEDFDDLTPQGLIACTWDLALICFERQAWVETVLANPAGPDLEAYRLRVLNADL